MNAEVLVVTHPHYAVTDEDGRFKLTGIPPGARYHMGRTEALIGPCPFGCATSHSCQGLRTRIGRSVGDIGTS